MRKHFLLAAAALLASAGTANATIITFKGITANGPGDNTFSYSATLGPDEGLRNGDQIVIFDFAGYIPGSIFSGSSDFAPNVQNTSPTAMVTPGFDDNTNVANLVFTYTGPDFRVSGGPFGSLELPLIGARSTFAGRVLDAFYVAATKNNLAGEQGTPTYTLSAVSVPHAAVPEPATWAMLVGGFGLLGAATRRRARTTRAAA